jgi:serine/threonine-protein kinase
MSKRDEQFARHAIGLKLVSQEQVDECAAIAAQRRSEGQGTTLARVLVDKGYLTREQVGAVAKAMRRPRLSRIGQFRLLALIGQGGMGTVYKAKQESLDKVVAVKVLSPALARRGDYVQRFLREARSCGQLNHPNVVLGISAGEADGYYYFAMEFVDGPTVKDILRRDGKIEEKQALGLAAAVAAGLEHAAEHNLVHRDIKPGNILLAPDGAAKLADLGLAKEVRTDQSITQAAIPIGTPYYISP